MPGSRTPRPCTPTPSAVHPCARHPQTMHPCALHPRTSAPQYRSHAGRSGRRFLFRMGRAGQGCLKGPLSYPPGVPHPQYPTPILSTLTPPAQRPLQPPQHPDPPLHSTHPTPTFTAPIATPCTAPTPQPAQPPSLPLHSTPLPSTPVPHRPPPSTPTGPCCGCCLLGVAHGAGCPPCRSRFPFPARVMWHGAWVGDTPFWGCRAVFFWGGDVVYTSSASPKTWGQARGDAGVPAAVRCRCPGAGWGNLWAGWRG